MKDYLLVLSASLLAWLPFFLVFSPIFKHIKLWNKKKNKKWGFNVSTRWNMHSEFWPSFEYDYLEHLVKERISLRYPNGLNDEKVMKRVNAELDVIKKVNISGYFLIIQDFIMWAKQNGILIGPGRGSATSSIIAYILGITELNPLHYNLFFERFLNLERYSMPCIIVDVSCAGRQKSIEYIAEKYECNLKVTRFPVIIELRCLSVIQNAVQIIEKTRKQNLDINNISLTDSKTFDIFKQGDTIGVGHFESPEMRKYLQELKPSCFEDLIAISILHYPYPSPVALHNIQRLISGKNNPATIDYYHENLKPALAETYGVIIFQEQIMQIIQILTDFSMGKADLLCHTMVLKFSKAKEDMDIMKLEFFKNGKNKGYSKSLLKKVWEDLITYSDGGSSCKSHLASRAYLAYQTAYLKANYPQEYMEAVEHDSQHFAKMDQISKQ
jgi:DNA polymerase III alpha subunit